MGKYLVCLLGVLVGCAAAVPPPEPTGSITPEAYQHLVWKYEKLHREEAALRHAVQEVYQTCLKESK